jgi:hypothetical protein
VLVRAGLGRGVLVRGVLVRVGLVGALLERYVPKVPLLERTEVDRALRVRAWLGEALLERTLLERIKVGRALLRRVPVLGYVEARCLVLVRRP